MAQHKRRHSEEEEESLQGITGAGSQHTHYVCTMNISLRFELRIALEKIYFVAERKKEMKAQNEDNCC